MQRLELNLKTILQSKKLRILNIKELQTNKLSDFTKKFPCQIITGYTQSLKQTTIPIILPEDLENKKLTNLPSSLNTAPQNKEMKIKGIEIPLNTVPLSKSGNHHKVFFCSAAVGNSIYSQHKQLKSLPTGFNSFITPLLDFKNSVSSTDKIIDEIVTTKQFSYILDSSRVLPLFEIEFEYDPNEKSHDGKCESCLVKESIMFCYAERAHLCEACDKSMHSNELLRRHKREYFTSTNESMLEQIVYLDCNIHSNTTIEFFCKDCLIPLCVQCRVSGSHSNYSPKEHRLISYIEASKNYQINFNSLAERETLLKNNIAETRSELKLFEKNVNEIKGKIESEYKSALNELKTFTNKHYRILNGRYLQSLYTRNRIDNLKEIVNKFNNAETIENFKNLINELSAISVAGDSKAKYIPIDLVGNLRVYTIDGKEQRLKTELKRDLKILDVGEVNNSRKENEKNKKKPL
ncbi:E3 ubiquitin-protein ligase arc-1 [Cucumispora dikerogammari]|nr:E3 ubiquitin-protein ligase arc-1 [Cucumispora dikerogammari]